MAAINDTESGVDAQTGGGSSVAIALQAAIGGVLMGLANLVPGVSGGTMLLVAGVYDRFIEAVADVTTLRFRRRSLITLVAVAGAAGIAILSLAGPVKSLVVHQRWIAYSLFIGLTLGGAPVVRRLARPVRAFFFAGAVVGLAVMAVMALTGDASRASAPPTALLFFVAGLAGAAAMILPGVSGGYLLLLIGAYVPILGAIDRLKDAISPGGADGVNLAEVVRAAVALAPVGLGVALGIAGVANALRWALDRFRQATLGALMGLLLGAILGLWPFQQARVPIIGEIVKGTQVTAALLPTIPVDDWPVARFAPTAGQVAAAVAMALGGLTLTIVIDRVSATLSARSAGGKAL